MRDRHHLWRRIILAVVLLCLILAGFFVYLHTTRNMTLDRDAGEPEKVRSHSRKINASGQQLLALINEVLDMSKIESGKTTLKPAPFSLSELLEELTAVFQTQAQAKEQTLLINAFLWRRA